MRKLAACCAGVCLMLACGDDGGRRGNAAGAPQERVDSVEIAGRYEQLTLARFEAPSSFPLEFSTYVPAGFVSKLHPADEDGAALQFTPETGPTASEDVFLHVFVYPQQMAASTARTLAQSYLISRGIPGETGNEPAPEGPPTLPRYAFAEIQEDFSYQGTDSGWREGVLLLGQRDDRVFHIIIHYPAALEATFLPRARLILEHWTWRDGSALITAS